MFTNWLTGSSSSTPVIRSTAAGIGGAGSGTPSGVSASALVMSSPPDVILEVGPAPSNVRFVAHSLVLGMHSGYLRSAIRLDEASASASATASVSVSAAAGATAAGCNPSTSSATTASGELLLYLSNVTADQFAPLLTYMYTGYLDLTVDNIFAVLLATHVLHMPRALEICRSFLARAQTEGYLNGNPAQLCPVPSIPAKVIRPIPSKATMPNFGFLPMPQAPPSAAPPAHPTAHPPTGVAPAPAPTLSSFGANSHMEHAQPTAMQDNEEDEDVEVFIDSNTVTDNEADLEPDVDMDCNVSVVSSLAGSSAGSLNIERLDVKPPTPAPVAAATIIPTTPKPQSLQSLQAKGQNSRRESNSKGSRTKSSASRSRKSSGLQVAKAPVPAAQLDLAAAATPITPSKFIIDVASCDGPVRFRRILNTAYGHKPEAMASGALGGPGSAPAGGGSTTSMAVEQHRSQQSVSYSFHQQMARAISSQQRQLSHQQQEESENSGDATPAAVGKQHATGATTASSSMSAAATASTVAGNRKSQATGTGSASGSSAGNQELYVCVYCKHTFKSQYCYQKHAKRHLNPLSLTTTDKKLLVEPAAAMASTTDMDQPSVGQSGANSSGGSAASGNGATAATSALLRREVRPLDMNVQYYPCKTCGSKFPSYYFVHKHRKMCHADEIEATATSNTSNNSSSNTSSSSSNGSNNGSNNNAKRDDQQTTQQS
ncbi:insulinoma-associated protein 1 [Drosophila simulans]|uniref:insulinoma-associated protein 1 n=1 Tax=Drosophila simulans TaxID=7240 RepID=UPI00192D1525|nr:insulinoma-associated protein 1 [Drosophila simulans]